MTGKQVCRREPQSKARLQQALAAGWSRCTNHMGLGKFADDADMDSSTVRRAIGGPSLPYTDNLLNSLAADPSALDEVLALYGLELRLRDGKRCHVDTAVLAKLFRPLIPQMQAIVDEDDRRRVAA